MHNDTHKMIKEYTLGIASQVGIPLSMVAFVEGSKLGCLDIHLMTLISNGHLDSVLVYQADVDNLQAGRECNRLELKIRSTLERLKSDESLNKPHTLSVSPSRLSNEEV